MAKRAAATDVVNITPANMVVMAIRIRGTAPYVQEAFSRRTIVELMKAMETSRADKKGKAARPTRNYIAEFEEAQHKSEEGWIGIPCSALRQSCIAACRTVPAIAMTTAKIALFIRADGIDAQDGTPLVRLQSVNGPEMWQGPVRNANGSIDIRVRPMWREWWADVQIEFDADMINAQSIVNLLDRAGRQVGIGAGRPFSKQSAGMGWGTFTVDQPKEQEQVA